MHQLKPTQDMGFICNDHKLLLRASRVPSDSTFKNLLCMKASCLLMVGCNQTQCKEPYKKAQI